MKTNTFIAQRSGMIELAEPDLHKINDAQDLARYCLAASELRGAVLVMSATVSIDALLSIRKVVEGEIMARAESVQI